MHNVGLQALFLIATLLNLFFFVDAPDCFGLLPDESIEQGQNQLWMLTCAITLVL